MRLWPLVATIWMILLKAELLYVYKNELNFSQFLWLMYGAWSVSWYCCKYRLEMLAGIAVTLLEQGSRSMMAAYWWKWSSVRSHFTWSRDSAVLNPETRLFLTFHYTKRVKFKIWDCNSLPFHFHHCGSGVISHCNNQASS